MVLSADASVGFGPADWAVLALYFVLLLGSGWWFSRTRPSGMREYFVGEGGMPVWAVAISVLATTLSAATFIGAPVESYTGDLTYLSTNLGTFIALVVLGLVFMPAFYRHQVTTVYELLSARFGPGARRAASAMFMLGRVFASGARLYIAAVPLTMILFTDANPPSWAIASAIALMSAVAVLYCFVGGIRSIIWTDVAQTVVFLGAAAAAAWVLYSRIPASPGEIAGALSHAGPAGQSKWTVIQTGLDTAKPWLGIDLTQAYTLLTAALGFSLFMVAAYGTDQDLVQRMLTCKSAARGSMSAVTATLVGLPVTALFTIIGLLLFVFYKQPGLMGAEAPHYEPARAADVFTTFILREMPQGLRGLMMAGLFAIALTSLMSALNAMSSTLITDFYRPLRPGRSEVHYLRASRAGVAIWGVVLGAFAVLCIWWQRSSGETLIKFALGVMTFAYSGLLGVYFTALLTRRGNSQTAVAALATGFATVLAMQPGIWERWTGLHAPLSFPWRLFFAAALATAVCWAGKPVHQRRPSPT